jgi:hypothetical protein
MTPVGQRNSHSVILRSTHIVLIEVVAAKNGPWTPSRPGLQSRDVVLSIKVNEVLRGTIDPPVAGHVSISITQYEYAGLLMMQPLPGPWPSAELKPGDSFAAFAETGESSIQRIFTAPPCTLVLPAEPVATGLRIASQAEAGNFPLERTLTLALGAADRVRLDPLFAEFLWDKYADAAMASAVEFNRLVSFAEAKELAVPTRQALLKGGYDLAGLHPGWTPKAARRLAQAMFRTLLLPEAVDLHENLVETFLPNLLGITSELSPQPASAVFLGEEELRLSSKEFLQQHGTQTGAKALLQWFGADRK